MVQLLGPRESDRECVCERERERTREREDEREREDKREKERELERLAKERGVVCGCAHVSKKVII